MRPSPYARALAFACAPAALLACSAIVSHLDAQCASDGDCAKFAGTACVGGGCITAEARVDAGAGRDASGPDTCVTTDDCLRRHGEAWICRHADGTCRSLRSPDCTTVLGAYAADDAIVFGALVPVYGEHASTGAAMVDALRLAVTDLGGAAAARARPTAFVICNESNGVLRPATHLASDLLVPAILGTADGASTVDLVNGLTLAGGTLVVSPRATTSALAGVASTGLVWRTCGSAAAEGAALTALTERVAADAAAQSGLVSARVALVHATDVTSTEIDATIAASLVIAGQPTGDASTFVHVDYGDPDRAAGAEPQSASYDAAVAAVVAAQPDVVVLVGSTQAAVHVLPVVESRWTGARAPRWVVSSGVQTRELLDAAATGDLRARILGTAPGGNDANRAAFVGRYRQAFDDGTPPEAFGVAQTFDAAYLLALAASTTTKGTPVGRDLSSALARFFAASDASTPSAITFAPTGLGGALDAVAAGRALAVDGASGPLAFDAATGSATTDVQVWCIAPGASPRFESAGLVYAAGATALSGTLACP